METAMMGPGYMALLVASLALITIGVALGLSALGLISIPEGLYSALAAVALAAIGARGSRVVQRRGLKKRYRDEDDGVDQGDERQLGADDPGVPP